LSKLGTSTAAAEDRPGGVHLRPSLSFREEQNHPSYKVIPCTYDGRGCIKLSHLEEDV
jgi:hypothetical protein